jgi:hypothetical protein
MNALATLANYRVHTTPLMVAHRKHIVVEQQIREGDLINQSETENGEIGSDQEVDGENNDNGFHLPSDSEDSDSYLSDDEILVPSINLEFSDKSNINGGEMKKSTSLGSTNHTRRQRLRLQLNRSPNIHNALHGN